MKSTFKKSLFFAAWCVAFLFGTVAFYSCSNEDLDEDSVQSKAELFRAKAKELSKKYGVDVTLNEENIEKMAETLTMEQFEREFRMFATMKFDTIYFMCKTVSPKKLRFKTKKRLAETPDGTNVNSVYTGTINIDDISISVEYSVWNESTRKYENKPANYSISGRADWRFQQTGSSLVDVQLDILGTPTATGGGSITIISGNVINGQLAFTARGRISFRSDYFNVGLMCSVICDERSPYPDQVILSLH